MSRWSKSWRLGVYLTVASAIVAAVYALSEAVYQAELRALGRQPGFGLIDSFITSFSDHPFSFAVWLFLALGGAAAVFLLAQRVERGDERLRAFLQSATETIVIGTDPHGVIDLFSRGAEQLLGYSATEVSGRQTIVDVLSPIGRTEDPPPDRSKDLAELLATARAAPPLRREWTCTNAMGEEIGIAISISPVHDRDRTLVGFVAVGNDITRRLRTLEALRQTNDTLKTIFASAPVAIVTRDRSGLVRNWNPAAERMFGWAEHEVLGTPSPIIPEDEPSAYELYRDRLERGEVVTDIAVTRTRRDGSRIDVSISAACMHDQAGRISGAIIVLQDVTERNRAIAELRESEERFRRLAEASFEGMVISANGRIVEANRAYARMFGYELDDVMGRSVLEFVVPELAPQIAAAIEAKATEPYETTARRKDGTTFDVEVLGRELRYGGAEARVAAVRDISYRKAAEQALSESEQRYRTIMESLAEGLLLQDAGGWVLASNESASEILRLTPEQLTREPPPPAGWTTIREDGSEFPRDEHPVAVALRTGQPCSDVVMGIVPPGEPTTWISVNARPICEPGEALPRAVVTSFVDITSRKVSEAATAQAYARAERERSVNRAIVDAASEALLLIGEDDTVVSCNQRFTELFQITEQEIVGKSADVLSTRFERMFGDEPATRDLVDGSDAKGHASKRLLAQIWPIAREFETYSTPVTGAESQSFGRLLAFRDVTHERAVDRMKTEFISLVSHELRTPLTSIKGYVDLMLEGEVGQVRGEQRDFLEIVRNNANRLTALINDLLDVSRIESGRIEMKRLPVDLERQIRDAVECIRPQTDAKGQRIVLEFGSPLPAVLGDPSRLMQVFLNLVDNAQKYTPPGGEIRITAARQQELVVVTIADTGIGLSVEEQAQVFSKFFRARNRWTSEVRGTGLGLPIARSLVELHGGEISVSSQAGQGTAFRISLPLRPAQAGAPLDAGLPARSTPRRRGRGRAERSQPVAPTDPALKERA